ncbi:aminotransferase [Vagococcus penaei]|uniref:Aminotransferase V n=1 Tax=Vagococcus penaei TaxID=633807 RepID=A0A1Q2D7K8_9ENTE|nr:cysteine desulfurase family protein [Vagococcus penaei]AQP54378.1 aminotransferase V [Vagococcus penaei]RSU06293.1 aminotransferase [Vagococcus penaei]
MIYFDNSATTKINPGVLDTYLKTSQRFIGNPSSLHRLGEQAHILLEKARSQTASLLDVLPEEIFFTSGGTEGNNWVIKGTAIEKRPFGKHIIVSSIEHGSVSASVQQLAELGCEISYLPTTRDGFIDVASLESMIRPDTILVSTMAVNNEIGTIQPIAEISEILEKYPSIHFHVDAVQAIGKVPTTGWLTERVDFATFSAHKFHGPKGVGFIYWKKGCKLAALLTGGGQEKNKRSGTENLPGIVAMAKALRMTMTDLEQKERYLRRMKNYLYESLATYPQVNLYSQLTDNLTAPHILCFGISGIKGEVLVHAFENKEIFISTTSACSSRKKMDSSTLHAMSVPGKLSETAVRVSFDENNTLSEVEQFLIIFKQLHTKFLKVAK